MLLIVTLAVTVLPKFLGVSNYSAEAYQRKLVSVLRNIQIRAMQDTRNVGYCFQVNFDNTNNAFGPPELDYNGDTADTCSSSIDTSNNSEQFYAASAQMTEAEVTIQAVNSDDINIDYLRFDGLGRPEPDSGDCDTGCVITFTAQSDALVCVESQGYIHAGACY